LTTTSAVLDVAARCATSTLVRDVGSTAVAAENERLTIDETWPERLETQAKEPIGPCEAEKRAPMSGSSHPVIGVTPSAVRFNALTRGSRRAVTGSHGRSRVRTLLSTTKTKVVSRTKGSVLVVNEAAASAHAPESSTTGQAAMNGAPVESTGAIATRADAIVGPTDALEGLADAIARSTGPLERSAYVLARPVRPLDRRADALEGLDDGPERPATAIASRSDALDRPEDASTATALTALPKSSPPTRAPRRAPRMPTPGTPAQTDRLSRALLDPVEPHEGLDRDDLALLRDGAPRKARCMEVREVERQRRVPAEGVLRGGELEAGSLPVVRRRPHADCVAKAPPRAPGRTQRRGGSWTRRLPPRWRHDVRIIEKRASPPEPGGR
jgi:hypothetical protein